MKLKGDTFKIKNRIAIAKRAIEDLKANNEGSAERVLKLFEGIIINVAGDFSNRALALGLGPEKLKKYHKLVNPESRRRFRPNIDREKYQTLKTDISLKILCELKTRDVPKNPYSYVRTMASNFCRDLANKEKHEIRFRGQYLVRDDDGIETGLTDMALDEKTRSLDIRRPDGTICRRPYIPGIDGPTLMDDPTVPEDLNAAPPADLKRRDLPHALDSAPFPKLERLYRQVFQSEDFRRSVEASVEFIDTVYTVKKALADPQGLFAKLRRAEIPLESSKKKLISIFGESAWGMADRYKDLEYLLDLDRWCANRGIKGERVSSADRGWYYDAKWEYPELSVLGSLMQTLVDAKNAIIFCSKDKRALYLEPYEKESRSLLGFLSWRFINISPPRMMFDVWKRADEIKRGKKGAQDNLNKMKLLFWYQKKKATGTPREYLFQKIRDDSDFENLRKYQYRNPKDKKARKTYRFLVARIYEEGFRARRIIPRITEDERPPEKFL